MAVLATQVTDFHKWPMGDGVWGIRFKYTGPGSYTSAGEVLSKTVCKQAMEGISEIYSLMTPHAMPVGGATAAGIAFEPLNTATNTGTFHFFNSLDAHTHSFLVKGGQAAAGTDATSIKGTTPVTIGKEAATDATNLGGVGGGVQNVTATTNRAEASAASAYSTYITYCFGIGRM